LTKISMNFDLPYKMQEYIELKFRSSFLPA